MAAPRHRKIPARKKTPAPDELEALSPVELEASEELPTLEAEPENDAGVDAGVKVQCRPGAEPGVEVDLAIEVPAMDKKAVTDALRGPLQRAVAQHATTLRLRRVLVHFPGEALIGTATKDFVASALAAAKPLKVIVRRGYGDEVVHQGTLPRIDCKTHSDGDDLHVQVASGDAEAEDLAVVLEPELLQLQSIAKGKRVTFTLPGVAQAPATLVEALRTSLTEAGAARAVVGDRVLFDRALEARVRISRKDATTSLEITPAPTDAETLAALDLVLGGGAVSLQGRDVRVRCVGRAPHQAEIDRLLHLCTPLQPVRIELVDDKNQIDMLWPRLLATAASDGQTTLRVQPQGRAEAAIAAAFRREVAALTPRLTGQRVTFDWPTGFALDATFEQLMLDALATHAPHSVSCSFGGEAREPFVPPPVTINQGTGGARSVRLDTDSGKPAELVRAIERRLRAAATNLRGQRVRIEVHGTAAASRSVLQALREECARAGAARLEIDEQGTIDVLVPALTTISSAGDDTMRVQLDPAGRDLAQSERALQRELDAAQAPLGTNWIVADSPLATQVVAALVERGAARVVIEGARGSVQVHPVLFAAPERDGQSLTLRASPDGNAATLAAQVSRELPALLAAHGDLSTLAITLVWPSAGEDDQDTRAKVLEAIVAAKPQRVLLDDGRARPRQVFPEIVPDYVTVLGKKDDPAAALVLLGIDAGTGDTHTARVMAKLETLASHIDGRRVLLVLRRDDADLAIRDSDPLIDSVRAFVDPRATATLVFRGRDAHGRPHFSAVHSSVAGVTAGMVFADPRRAK